MSDRTSTSDLILWGAIAVGVYFVWQAISRAGAAVGQAASAAAGAIASPVADLWVSLTAAPAIRLNATGQFPDGTTVDLSTLPIKQDAQGNVYTRSNGVTYQLQPWVTVPAPMSETSGATVTVYPLVAVGS